MKENILIVDDEEEIAELVGVYLKNEGFTVLICHNGADALACVEREEISLAVLDVMLPDTDGFTPLPQDTRAASFPDCHADGKDRGYR